MDLDRWSDWAPQISAVETSSGARRLVVGLRGTVVGPLSAVRVRFEVLDVDDALTRWSWRVELGPITVHLAHGVDAAPTGTVATLHLTGSAPVVLPYAPLAWFALTRLVRP